MSLMVTLENRYFAFVSFRPPPLQVTWKLPLWSICQVVQIRLHQGII